MPPIRQRHLASKAAIMIAVTALFASSCADPTESTDVDASPSSSSTAASAPTPTSTASASSPSVTTEPAPGSSSSAIDLEDGRHAVFLRGIDVDRRQLTVDVVQWLTGEEAEAAYRDDHPGETDGPPNDYYIVNENPRLRDLPVADDVTVALVRLLEDSDADLDPGTWADLPSYLADYATDDGRLSYNPFWVTVEGQVVVDLEEQYTP